MTPIFDRVQYKTTTRQQWDDAAEAWHRWGPTLETWLGDATDISGTILTYAAKAAAEAGLTNIETLEADGEGLEAALTTAGFSDVTVDVVSAPVRLPLASDCVRFEQESFGALHQMLAGVPADERPAVWDEIEVALSRFESADSFVGPCELLVGSGTR